MSGSEKPMLWTVAIKWTMRMKKRRGEWEKSSEVQKKPVEELGYKVDKADGAHKKRKEEWETGQVEGVQFKKADPAQRGYNDEAEDINKRCDEWEKGKLSE